MLRVFLVDDDEDDFIITRDLLHQIYTQQFHLDWAASYEDALASIGSQPYDVYLFDYRLGQHDGLELLQAVARRGDRTPVIVLTGQGDREIDVQVMKAGAADYLVKGQITPELLERSIRYALERVQHQEALEAAKLAAEKANRAKSLFLANMSHELRTPITVIIGFASTLAEEAKILDAPEIVTGVQRIQMAANQLLELISNVLDLSKIEAGKVELHLEDFDVYTLFSEVVMTVQPLVKKNGNTLKVIYGDDVGVMHADYVRMRQILLNLLNNAAKFTQQGQITLRVNCGNTETNEWLTFCVSDTGIGMTEEQTSRIFEEFEQAERTTTRNFGGTGLGLTISRHLCQLMGGSISVKSEVGQGSVFTVKLPSRVKS